jgi:hypothetical protein
LLHSSDTCKQTRTFQQGPAIIAPAIMAMARLAIPACLTANHKRRGPSGVRVAAADTSKADAAAMSRGARAGLQVQVLKNAHTCPGQLQWFKLLNQEPQVKAHN